MAVQLAMLSGSSLLASSPEGLQLSSSSPIPIKPSPASTNNAPNSQVNTTSRSPSGVCWPHCSDMGKKQAPNLPCPLPRGGPCLMKCHSKAHTWKALPVRVAMSSIPSLTTPTSIPHQALGHRGWSASNSSTVTSAVARQQFEIYFACCLEPEMRLRALR